MDGLLAIELLFGDLGLMFETGFLFFELGMYSYMHSFIQRLEY